MGPEKFCDMPRIKQLVAELGLKARCLNSSAALFSEGL